MIEKFPFSWDEIHTHFPEEKVAKLRKKLTEEYNSNKYSDKELIDHYHMSKQTFYETIERYKNASDLTDFMDDSKAPKEPHRTILPEHKELVKNIIKVDREELRKKQNQFETDMELSGKNLKPDKLNKLKTEMKSSMKGCRKIAYEFNMQMSMKGEEISISKSTVNNIESEMKSYQITIIKQFGSYLDRPKEPSISFAMDFTQKVIAGGESVHIINIIDKYNNEKIILDAHKSQDADAVVYSLEKFNKQLSNNEITITVDNGKEFKNDHVADYCSKNNISLNFINPGSPWENGFVERDMRTLKEECLNLIWINNFTEIQPLLDNYKQESNFRPNMAFGYMSPYEKKAEFLYLKIYSEKNLLCETR